MTIKLGSFPSLLTVAFIVLKLTRVIDWGWIAVFAPLWLPVIGMICIMFIAALLSKI